MFQGRQTNNGSGVSVNTRLYTSYSDTCLVTLGGWNANLSLKFAPFKGVDANGLRQYAQDSTETVMTSLTVENTTALLEGIKDKILPALEAKTTASVSVTVGVNNNRKVISVLTDGESVQLKIYVNVSDTGIADGNNSVTHTFNKKEYMAGYDPTTGNGEVVNTNADFKNFINKLNDIYKFSGAEIHAVNYNNAIKASYGNNRQTYNNNSNVNTGYSAPTTNVTGSDMSSFLPFE